MWYGYHWVMNVIIGYKGGQWYDILPWSSIPIPFRKHLVEAPRWTAVSTSNSKLLLLFKQHVQHISNIIIYIYSTDLSHLQHPQHPHPNPISTPIPTPSPHLLGDGHLIKGRQRGKHRAADPRREAALGIAHHLHLQRPRGLPGGDVKGKRLEQQGKVWMDLGRTRYMDDDGKIDLGRTMDS